MKCWRCGCKLDEGDAIQFDTSLYSGFMGSGIYCHCIACIRYIEGLLRSWREVKAIHLFEKTRGEQHGHTEIQDSSSEVKA